jgi:coproporphyrinogen III oxidase
MVFKQEVAQWFQGLQDRICRALEAADGKATFQEDAWKRHEGGGGRSRAIAHGNIIEKGGVNFSAVHGKTPEKIRKALQLSDGEFFATGVSIVLHPYNPFVPIIHMNVRYFEISDGTYWFGGGIDLTPHYINDNDAHYFHSVLKTVCDKHHPAYYPAFKRWADDYFYLPHRQETRGIGGIFFDRLFEDETFSKIDRWKFVQAVGEAFAPIYTYYMQKNHGLPYSEPHKQWQKIRRGRYVEFNLVWDKGTKFGLDTDGRTESILMSMPPEANWVYNYQPAPGSEEAATLQKLVKGMAWV